MIVIILPYGPESRLNVKKSNTKRKRKILMSLEKKRIASSFAGAFGWIFARSVLSPRI